MHQRLTRRQVSASMFGTIAGLTLATRAGSAQTPPASPASTDAGADPFDTVAFEPGVIPTIYGDVTLPESVGKVVTLTDGALDAMIAIGVQPIGVTSSSNGETVAAYLADKVEDSVTYVGGWGELDREAIILLEPDVILSDRYLFEEEYTVLTEIAPTIATLEIEVPDADALQQWEYEQLAWAHATGRLDEAKTVLRELRARASDMREPLNEHQGESVVVFRPQDNFPVVMSHHWITGVMLSWTGLRGNDLTESAPPPHTGDSVSLERLDLLAADWLFAATRNAEMEAALQTYLENPSFKTIAAVQNGRVAQVPGDLWSGATGVLAGHAMLDDIERILVNGDY